jgi:hypothetical protein
VHSNQAKVSRSEVSKEGQYLNELAWQFDLSPSCDEVCTDNTGAMSLDDNSPSLDRSKDIDAIYHHVCQRIVCCQVKFLQVPS